MAEQKRARVRVRLVGVQAEETAPEVAIHLIDAEGETLASEPVGEDGQVTLDPKVLGKAARVIVGPVDREEAPPGTFLSYRASTFHSVIERGMIEIGRGRWQPWLSFTRCVSGSARRCIPKPWIIDDLYARSRVTAVSEPALATERWFPAFPRCSPVCIGVVEVYERRCCCDPIVVFDPRIDDIIAELENIGSRPLPEPIPEPDPPPILPLPEPGPDPLPFERLERIATGGALDVRKVGAERDLAMLRRLGPVEQVAYLQARPYLWCHCSDPAKVADGLLHDDGTFDICWREPLWLFPPNCRVEVAYKVKQPRGGSDVTIYDGVAAGQWFDPDDEASLTSYHPLAVGCRERPVPGTGAFVVLQDIGDTESHRLATPVQDGVFSVATPDYNDGLLDPVASPDDAKGVNRNRNFGGLVRLRYEFSDGMKAVGAVYYRVKVAAANVSGEPVGGWTVLPAPAWKFWDTASFEDSTVALGPTTQGGETNLYLIPFDGTEPIQPGDEWHDGQYHALLDTGAFANGRYLVAIEVFDGAGNRLRPNGAAGAGTDTAFTFRRWDAPGETSPVPFAALSHLLWWDNRRAQAVIVDIRKQGSPSSAQCQFLQGDADQEVSIGYRAYHPKPDSPPPSFVLKHSMVLRRGLAGPTWRIEDDPGTNVGYPPGSPHVSQPLTFGELLEAPPVGLTKCAFSVVLHVVTKTTNGEGHSSAFDDTDQAAFAAEVLQAP